MATITIFDPETAKTKSISVNIEASMVIQNFLGEIEYFLTFTTVAKDVMGNAIEKQTVSSLTEGAGGGTDDKDGNPLSGGKYSNLTTAIEDYVGMMVEGKASEPWKEMAFV